MPKPKKTSLADMPSPDSILENLQLDRILDFQLNPRTWFDPQKLQELASSLKANNQIAPIIVREVAGKPGYYEVIVGARRVKASRIAELSTIKAEIRELSDREALILAKEENNNREDPSPIEDTMSTLNLIQLDTGLEHEEITPLLHQMAKGRNVPTDFKEKVEIVFDDLKTITFSTFVKDRLRLLKLPTIIFEAIRQGNIEPTKGVEIGKLKDEQQQQELLETAIAEKLSIREIKSRISQLQGKATTDYSKLQADELKTQVKQSYSKLSRNKQVWSDPSKRKQIETLLENLDRLVAS